MPSFLTSDVAKVIYGVTAIFAFSFGDFFYAHRLPVDTDLLLLVGGATALGVHVALNTTVTK